MVGEGNEFLWPGYDLRKIPHADRAEKVATLKVRGTLAERAARAVAGDMGRVRRSAFRAGGAREAVDDPSGGNLRAGGHPPCPPASSPFFYYENTPGADLGWWGVHILRRPFG